MLSPGTMIARALVMLQNKKDQTFQSISLLLKVNFIRRLISFRDCSIWICNYDTIQKFVINNLLIKRSFHFQMRCTVRECKRDNNEHMIAYYPYSVIIFQGEQR